MSTFSNPITTEQFEKAYQIGAVSWKETVRLKLEQLKAVMSLFTSSNTSILSEELGELPSEGAFASQMGEVEDIPLISDAEGDYITSTLRPIGYRRIVSGRALQYNRYPQIARILRGNNNSLVRRMILDATHKFTFANSGSYTNMDGVSQSMVGGDGVSMVNDSHVMNNGSSWDNLLGSGSGVRLSESTWQDANDLAADIFDHAGALSTSVLDVLITGHHAATKATAMRLTGQASQVSVDTTADNVLNGLNTHRGTFRHVELPLLATNAAGGRDSNKNRYWFGLDSSKAKDSMFIRVGMMPRAFAPVEAENKYAVIFKGMADYDIGHLGGRHIIGALAA